MAKKDTGFDAFFKAVTSSPEFKTVVEKDWKGDFEEGLKKMEENISSASSMLGSLKDSFDTKQARDIGNNYITEQYQTKNSEDDDKPTAIDIKYFKKKNPKTWGFAGIAGMQELKNELRENFIKPLKFKFMMMELENSPLSISPQGREENKKSSDNLDSGTHNSLSNSLHPNPLVKSPSSPHPNPLPTGEGIENEQAENNEEKTKLYKQIHEAYKKFGVSIPTGMLFYGPPGTGKTFITKKLAQELGAGLIKKSVGEFGSSYIHATSKNIRDFFSQAKKASERGPIILFLDELDSLVSKRTNNIDANKAEEVSQFLQEFNALEEAPNLIVIAATNRPDHLDSAILRSGRLDKKIYIGPPDFEARKELFKIFIEKENKPHKDLDYEKLAKLTDGYVPADIEAIVDEVARDASQAILDLANNVDKIKPEELKQKIQNSVITMELLEKAIKETTPSTKFVDMSIFDEWIREEKEKIRV